MSVCIEDSSRSQGLYIFPAWVITVCLPCPFSCFIVAVYVRSWRQSSISRIESMEDRAICWRYTRLWNRSCKTYCLTTETLLWNTLGPAPIGFGLCPLKRHFSCVGSLLLVETLLVWAAIQWLALHYRMYLQSLFAQQWLVFLSRKAHSNLSRMLYGMQCTWGGSQPQMTVDSQGECTRLPGTI